LGSRTVEEYLQNGIDGEHFEVDEMHPSYMEVAKAQKEHAAFFERAMDAVQN